MSNKLDKAIADTASILDHLVLLREIQNTGDCNTCKVKKNCRFAPKIGEIVRYNCPFYNGKIWFDDNVEDGDK